MVKVGKYDTFTEYLQAYRIQGTVKLTCMLIGIDWLRLGIIVFGYLLLRPILIRQAARFQTNQLEKEDARLKKEAAEAALKTNKATGKDDIQWGQSVKTRQRKNEERMIVAGEESDDDDLQDLLTR